MQFEQPRPIISVAFWKRLSTLKLEKYQLDDSPIPIYGQLFKSSPNISLDFDSFEEPRHSYFVPGTVRIFNTIEDYKKFNRSKFLVDQRDKYLCNFQQGNDQIEFILLVFADLKHYKFIYQFYCPSICLENVTIKVTEEPSLEETMENLNLKFSGDAVYINDYTASSKALGWPIRNQLTYLAFNKMTDKKIVVFHGKERWRIELQQVGDEKWPISGWERDSSGKFLQHTINLAETMDPSLMAKEASELNLKLIRWRLLPSFELEAIASARCLLLGAGTLGCNVGRALLAWGVRQMTFVDSGKVSLSNPVRQSLFVHADSLQSRSKAEAAAQMIKAIAPTTDVSAVVASIPMPGHIASPSWRSESTRVEDLVKSHDVVFLLTDSRESRWLPSVLGAAMDKLVITIALGFDCFVAMRHGSKANNLSCYFCSDPTSPRDTMSYRTLDQQCTVTRPGCSMIAAGLGVEIMASALQHPQRHNAPADSPSILGSVPHQVRGMLSIFEQIRLVGHSYSGCVACSDKIIGQYRERGMDFIYECLDNPECLVPEEEAIDLDCVENFD